MKTTILLHFQFRMQADILQTVLRHSGYEVFQLTDQELPAPVRKNLRLKKNLILLVDCDHYNLEKIKQLSSTYANSILMGLCHQADTQYIKQFTRIGGKAILSSNTSLDMFQKSLTLVQAGQLYIAPDLQDLFVKELVSSRKEKNTSAEEIRVVNLLQHGLNSREIADQMHLTESHVASIRYKLLRRYQLNNTASLIRHFYTTKLALC